MKTIKYEAMAGNDIQSACEEAVAMAKQKQCNVQFIFNDQIITATPASDPESLAKLYMDECQRAYDKWTASPEYKKQQEDYEAKEKLKNESLAAALAVAPEHMTLRDADGWKKFCELNNDPYGGAVVEYSERWARLMEARMSKGERIADIANDCSHLADNDGITGFMYGCAVGVLAKVWIHGEALRLWHNLKTQIRHEGEKANESGGILNPALLSIGESAP